jgi:hypothetical protein
MSAAALVQGLIGAAGSGRAAARILGTSPSTVYRWRDGKAQPKVGRQAIVAGIRAYTLATNHPGLLGQLGPGRKGLSVHAYIRVSRDARKRTADLGPHVPAKKIRNVVRAWMMGNDARAERLLGRALDTHYAKGAEIEDYINVWFS